MVELADTIDLWSIEGSNPRSSICYMLIAGVVELADTRDLKSREFNYSFRFEPGHRQLTCNKWSFWDSNPGPIGYEPTTLDQLS